MDAGVDTDISKMKAPYTREEFDKQLAASHMSMDGLRAQVRRQLTVSKLINKEITSHITITDADVTSFTTATKRLQPGRAAGEDQGHRRPPAARRRFRHAGAELLGGPRVRAERRRHGLRPAVGPGEGQPILTQNGYLILKVITREAAGQRELNAPCVQQSIRDTLMNCKDQLLKSAYYEAARNGAKIQNYLAQEIVEKK